jgi:hypothetical protein
MRKTWLASFTTSRFALLLSAHFLLAGSNAFAKAEGPAPIDGVSVEAVETYQNPKSRQIDIGLSLLPLNPYFNAFGIDVGYTNYFDKTYSWQIVDLDYVYTVNTGITSQLAQTYGVNPNSIERLNFLVSSNFQYVFAYGKFIFAKQYIRYFRSAALIGPTYASSNKESTIGGNIGLRFEVFVNDDFSWVFQMRDIYMPSNIGNNLAFVLSTAYGF